LLPGDPSSREDFMNDILLGYDWLMTEGAWLGREHMGPLSSGPAQEACGEGRSGI